jgi:hypothetical protein
MIDKDSKVIGFIAQKSGTVNLICDGDSAIVAGSEKKMHDYINSIENENVKPVYEIKKARYGHIQKCLQLGASYSFDEESYGRFYPLAKDENKKLIEFGKDSNEVTQKAGTHLMRIKWI